MAGLGALRGPMVFPTLVTDEFRFTQGQTDSCTGSDVADMAAYSTSVLRPLDGRKDQEGDSEVVSGGRRQSARTY